MKPIILVGSCWANEAAAGRSELYAADRKMKGQEE